MGACSGGNPINMRNHLYMDTLNPREFDWALSLHLTHAPDILFSLLGLFGLFSETFFGLVLFSRVARRIFPVAAIMLHVGIFLFQRILFIDLILLQLVFFDFTPIRKAISGRLASKRGRLQVLYDGLCPLCCRTVRLLACLDIFQRLQFLDFRLLDLDEYNRSQAVNLKPGNLEKEMYVVSRGQACHGFYGYRRLALAVPAFWVLAPCLFYPEFLPSVCGSTADAARHRLRFHCATTPPVPSSLRSKASQRRSPQQATLPEASVMH